MLESGRALPYDWLILATGARHSYFGRDDWARHAPGLKSIEDALADPPQRAAGTRARRDRDRTASAARRC